ncbi:DUF2851 family protein [Melioribacteraceae bacterium 4301-Me]|uniref:DUF2851 family protein n=1 Tax=Pyranulibacter aquaticus TaxID=3163344 RepID=UPI003595C812
MHPSIKLYEKQLYEIWENQSYTKSLHTVSGEEVHVLDVGVRNEDISGPDYRNARIRIGNLTFVGDIEIDRDYADWKVHGHNIDAKYTKVILHATLSNKNKHPYVYSRDGRKIPTVCMAEFLPEDVVEKILASTKENSNKNSQELKCQHINEIISKEEKEKFLSKLGMERFNKKCKRIYNRLKELTFIHELKIKEPVISYELTPKFYQRNFNHNDFTNKEIWQQLLYELIFEALGYSKNKSVMMQLAQHTKIDYLTKIEQDGLLTDKYEAILFKISGMIPKTDTLKDEESIQYVEKLNLLWNSFSHFYDGVYLLETQWHFFRLRPQNFPTIRIAAGAKILNEIINNNLVASLARKIEEIRNPKVLINSLRSMFILKSAGYWRNHYIFGRKTNAEIKYLVGASRADEIIINVIFPYFAIYFEIFGNAQATKKIFKLYDLYIQNSDNNLVLEMGQSLKLQDDTKRTIISQGMIELFRNYCSKNKCLECDIGKIVFN